MAELILMSGGVDSAMLLYRLATKDPWFDYPDATGDIDLLAVNCGQTKTAIYWDLIGMDHAVTKVQAVLNQAGGDTKGKITDISPQLKSSFNFSETHSVFRQAPAWLFAAFELVRCDRHKRVHIGYLRDDGIAPEIQNLRTIWDLICKTFIQSPHPPQLTFRLFDTFITKVDVLEWYEKSAERMSLYNTTWSCETPVGGRKSTCTPCGSCGSCASHRAALFKFKIKHGRDFGFSAGTAIIKPQPIYPDTTHPGQRLYWEMVTPGYMHVPRRVNT
jgi:hypothetical protein